MNVKKILIIDHPHPFFLSEITALGFQCDDYTDASYEAIYKIVNQYAGIFIRSRIEMDERILSQAKQLKFIARAGAGLESIDVNYAKSKGIKCISSPEGNRDAVAEHALGMLLSLFNNLNRADQQVRNGLWIREGNRGIELMGKTVGIIGYGNMGRAFAKRLQGFGCKVIAYDKYKQNYGDEFAEAVSLAQLQAESDIVSFHIYYEPDNHYLFNAKYLNGFAKNIFVINTARGLILNTADLVTGLKNGKVLGAALDVLEYEGLSFEQISITDLPLPFQYLVESDKVILSPHVAGWTYESKLKHAATLVEKIKREVMGW